MSDRIKIVVTAPASHADALREAIGKAGGGKVGNYSFCSYSINGTGRFLPEEGATPAIGKVGAVEQVPEERIEVNCDREQLTAIVAAIKSVHPYEEPVIDAYPLLSLE